MVARPEIIRQISRLRQVVAAARREGCSLGLVPTMGALHEGHLSLVRRALHECDTVAVTIFVNPAQFAPHEDLATYPRTFDDDVGQLSELGTPYVFAPATDDLYPPGFSTYVEPPAVAQPWEGACRPQFFRGVATIVLKLFNLIPADVAYFGQKDYQQWLVIRHMTDDLNLPIDIRRCPIVREADGLAMSSRNRYLDATERVQAVAPSNALQAVEEQFASGERDAFRLAVAIREVLVRAGIDRIDYATVADARTLKPVDVIEAPAVALVAAHVGTTRLIDNCLLGDGI